MNPNTSNSNSRNARTLIASLLSYVLLASQLTPMALATNGPSFRSDPSKVSDIARGEKVGRRSMAAEPVSLAPLAAPNIVATKVDSYAGAPNPANPGDVITYDVTISNTGTADATAVVFNDTIDPNTTLVPGSVNTQPITTDDAYDVLGNVRIQPNAAAGLLANDIDPDTGTNTGLTASAGATSTQGGSVSVNADGSFSYNPPAGFEGTDTFTYTVTDTGGKTDTGTVTLTITGMIWFVNAAAGGGGDGRLDELLRPTGEMEIVLRNFAPDAEFAGHWGEARVAGRWRIPAGDVRHFLETVWTHGAELVSVTPVNGDLTSLFLEWTGSEVIPR